MIKRCDGRDDERPPAVSGTFHDDFHRDIKRGAAGNTRRRAFLSMRKALTKNTRAARLLQPRLGNDEGSECGKMFRSNGESRAEIGAATERRVAVVSSLSPAYPYAAAEAQGQRETRTPALIMYHFSVS